MAPTGPDAREAAWLTRSDEILADANYLADELFFPDALVVDAARRIPIGHLDAIAARGFYGLNGPEEFGGRAAGPETANAVVEVLAGGCLATTFVWNQHHSAVRAISGSTQELRDSWLRPLCEGSIRSGVAFGSLRRSGPPLLLAARDGNDWRLTGVAPWITGWGLIDVVHVAARTVEDDVVWCLIDAQATSSMRVTPLELAALNASSTVTLELDGYTVPAERITLVEQFATWQARDRAGLRANGSLALGAARRCARLVTELGGDAESIESAVTKARSELDHADLAGLPGARARATLVALDAATMLVVGSGGSAVICGTQAERLFREAMFLLVFGQTTEIKAAQFDEVSAFSTRRN